MALVPRLPRTRWTLLAAVAAAASLLAPGAAAATNDTHWSRQWAPVKIGAPAAWEATTGAGVKIGIIDSGVDLGHQDLQGGKITANASCVGSGGNPASCVAGGGQDVAGHGTHVAGIAAANKDNGVGIAGIAPDAQLVVARVFSGDTAELADVEAAIKWTVDQGARVVNLSLGENALLGGLFGGGGSLGPALDAAWARGAIPVVAAGNAQLLTGSAGYGDVNAVIVGATGPDDEIASYSVSTGSAKWAIVAPGGNGADARQVFSTYWRAGSANQYGYLQGTSMATPHVSGTLALLLARGLSPQRAVEVLLASANKAVQCGATCAGRLDTAAAVAATGFVPAATTSTTGPPPPTAAPTTAAPTTAAPRTRVTTAPTVPAATSTVPAPATVPPDATTTTPPTPPPPPAETTVAPGPDPGPGPDTGIGTLAAGRRDDEEDDDVGGAGAAAGLLLAGVAAAAVVVRRRRAPRGP
ncbi:MAG: S8 family serine peptidase [Actinomycetota bacterium]